jgi:hypothetical protein
VVFQYGGFLKLAVHASPENSSVIQELLSVWDISWGSAENSDAVIVYGRKPLEIAKKTVLIPSDSINLDCCAERAKPIAAKRPGKPIYIKVTPEINLLIVPQVLFEVEPATHVTSDDLFIPKFDFIEEYNRILRRTLAARSSLKYRLATSLPLPYNIAPKRLRDYLMTKHDKNMSLCLYDVLPIDALRFALANGIEQLVNKKLRRKTWDHRACVCVLTHDIDTKEGLKKSIKAKKLEEKYDAPSAWFIPSKQYPLDHDIIGDLENNGEIGSHDTKHDGRLSHLSKRKLVKRLNDSKNNLESITNHPVAGFRAPLLQHNSSILRGLQECGYTYDTSIPTWEAKHPRTMSSHGIGTVFPTNIEGTNEIPITIMQDHQLLHVLGFTPKEAISEWLSAMTVLNELGGCCVFLSHPEYGLLDSQGLILYEQLLNTITTSHNLLLTLPNKIVQI